MYICKREFFIKEAREEEVNQIAGLYKCSLENLKNRKGLEERIKKIVTQKNVFSETVCYTINDFYKSVIGAVFVKQVEKNLEIRIWIPEVERNLKKEIKESIIDFYKVSGYSCISKIIILKENLEQPFSFKGYVENTNIVLKHGLTA